MLEINRASVFDWLITTDAGIIRLIETDMRDFFDKALLRRNANDHVVHTDTDTVFLHEFPEDTDFETQYARHAPKMAKLVSRWLKLLASDQRVLFVRDDRNSGDARKRALLLRDTLQARAPNLRFTLLYLTDEATQTDPWEEADVINRPLRQPEDNNWHGDDDQWSELLLEIVRPKSIRALPGAIRSLAGNLGRIIRGSRPAR